MSTELRELYQEVIVDHSRRPRNFRALDGGARSAEGYNPLCGDRCTVYVRLEGDVLREVTFQGSGCAISTASASVMTEAVSGKSRSEVQELFERFHSLVTRGLGEAPPRGLGKLAVFAGVSEFPSRVKCAILPWHTLQAALRGEKETVTTE